jgi:hypothetical protein
VVFVLDSDAGVVDAFEELNLGLAHTYLNLFDLCLVLFQSYFEGGPISFLGGEDGVSSEDEQKVPVVCLEETGVAIKLQFEFFLERYERPFFCFNGVYFW